MSWIKDNVGLDWFDLAIHGTVTGLLMGALSEQGGSDLAVLLTATASVIGLAVRRSWALRKRPPSITGISSGEMAAMRFEEMEQRLNELEASQARVAELEARLEFAERLLAEPTADRALPVEARAKGTH